MEQSNQGGKYAQIIMLTYQVLVYNSKQLAIHDKACKVLDVAQQVEELKNKQIRTHNFEKKFRTDFFVKC